jgi:hypothetical protein
VTIPPRVRITHPRTEAGRRAPHRPAVREIDEQTRLGDVYMSSLIRSQRRLALLVCTAIALLLVGTALVGAVSSTFVRLHLFGIPLPWLVLGLFVYPTLIALGWFTVRSAERTERDFLELVRRR